MKVYGTNIYYDGQQRRAVVAARSQKEAARIFGVSLHEFRNYGSETGNAFEISLAMDTPGAVSVMMDDPSAPAAQAPWLTLHVAPGDAR